MPSNREVIELRSDEVQEILGETPSWIIRWGITMIFMTVLILVGVSWFMKYPDIITAKIVITTKNPPVRLMSRSPGKITFLTNDGEEVEEGQSLGYIQNSADFEDMKYIMTQFQKDKDQFLLKENLNLGELQVAYETFSSATQQLNLFYELGKTDFDVQSIYAQVDSYDILNENLHYQLGLIQQEVKIAAKKYQVDSSLFSGNMVSELDLNQTKSGLIQQQRSFKNAESGILNNNLQIRQLKAKAQELQIIQKEQEKKLILAQENAYQTLKSQVRIWKEKYIIQSPVTGMVSFLQYWSDNQFVDANTEVIVVVPDSQQLIGKVALPVAGSGKVEKGQQVNIRLLNYPAEEFGMILGKVEAISLVPQNKAQNSQETYIIQVNLPEGLKTTYHKQLDFKSELQGSVAIVTKDLRLLERIFNQFRGLFDNV